MKFYKAQIIKAIIFIFILSNLKIYAQTSVTVDMTNGRPQIFVNNSPVRPRMFWGSQNGRRIDVCYRRQRISFDVSTDSSP